MSPEMMSMILSVIIVDCGIQLVASDDGVEGRGNRREIVMM